MSPRLSPVFWLDRWLTAFTHWQLVRETVLVEHGPHGFKRILFTTVLRLVLVFAVLVINADLFGWWDTPRLVDLLATAIWGGLLGLWAMSALARPMAYRNGWLKGRQEFTSEVPNHDNIVDLINAQRVRDEWVMGFIRMPQSPEGLGD